MQYKKNPYLKLCRAAKRHGVTADNIEWFVNMAN